MKFAFVIFKYFPFGGAQRDMLRIARQCHERGHQVTIFTMEWQGPIPEPGIDVEILNAKGLLNHWRYQDFFCQVRQRLTAAPCDVVIGFNRMPGLDVYFAADPCFREKTGYEHSWLKRLSGRYRFFANCEREVFKPASHCEILLLSPREEHFFQKWYGTPASRFHLIPPVIEVDRFHISDRDAVRHQVREEFGWQAEDNLLLLVGSGFRTKGLDRAIASLAQLPEELRVHTRLLAVGQDNPRVFCTLAQRLGVDRNVKIIGGREDIPRLMGAADVLIHPARSELAGHVLVEALAAGLPVLTTDVCGYAHHVAKADAGVVMPEAAGPSAIAVQLEQLLQAPALHARGENGRRYVSTLVAESERGVEAGVIEAVGHRKAGTCS